MATYTVKHKMSSGPVVESTVDENGVWIWAALPPPLKPALLQEFIGGCMHLVRLLETTGWESIEVEKD